ncbi:MAG: hypothetical protein ACRDFB_04190, partial [Rhabdochlamydiaceae bacterium]
FSLRVVNSLSSIGLALALISPVLSLLIQLKEEGWNSMNEGEFYKNSYRLGMTLLSVYIFVVATTLSVYLEAAILGADITLAYL